MNLSDNAKNRPFKFRTKIEAEKSDNPIGKYGVGDQIKFKTKMRRSSLCDYNISYTLVKGTIKTNRSKHPSKTNRCKK